MIKEHDHQAKVKATPKKLINDDSEEECSDSSKMKGLLKWFSNGSFEMSKTPERVRSLEKSQRSLSQSRTSSHIKRFERLENKIKSKAKTIEGRTKYRTRRSGYKGTNFDSNHEEDLEDTYSNHEEDLEDTCEDLSMPYKRPKPTPFTPRITRFKYHQRAKLPRNIKVYASSKDPKDHLGIFSIAVEQEEWPMPIWCKMFHQTLSGATRNWFDDLDPKSVDNFEELSQKFLEEFSQQKRYAKYPTKIHGIKRRLNEGLQMKCLRGLERSSGVKSRRDQPRQLENHNRTKETPVLDGTKAKRESEEGAIQENSKGALGHVLPTQEEIRTPEKQNLKKYCDYHGDRAHNTNNYYHLKKQIEEAMASEKLAHLGHLTLKSCKYAQNICLIVHFCVFNIWETLGGNTHDLDSIWEETRQDYKFTLSGFKDARTVLGDGVAIPSDAVRTYKRKCQELCDNV
nr:reverse transcriptase domain-containing protein [Tanacetum cinerariifolium]